MMPSRDNSITPSLTRSSISAWTRLRVNCTTFFWRAGIVMRHPPPGGRQWRVLQPDREIPVLGIDFKAAVLHGRNPLGGLQEAAEGEQVHAVEVRFTAAPGRGQRGHHFFGA